MYLTAYDGVYVTECHQALNSDVLQLTPSTSDWQAKHNTWKQLFMSSAEFCVSWPLSLMINASFFFAQINFFYQHLWTSAVVVSNWSFPLISALSAIIIVVNNAATVTDLIAGCQCVRAAGSFVLPRWSLSVADRLHKRKATLDQYVSNDDRLVPEKCLQCFMHVRQFPLQICLRLDVCMLVFCHMQKRKRTIVWTICMKWLHDHKKAQNNNNETYTTTNRQKRLFIGN